MKKIIPFLFVLLLILTTNFIFRKYSKDTQLKKEYFGIIINKYIDNDNRGACMFLINQGSLDYKENMDVYPLAWDYADIGDSVVKQKGDLFIKILKKSKYAYFNYEYQ